MWKYIAKRIAIAIPVLIGITIIDYGLMCLAGSPLDMLTGPRVAEGALEARARRITEDMMISAAHAIAGRVSPAELAPDHIIPSIFDKAIAAVVADAVKAHVKE